MHIACPGCAAVYDVPAILLSLPRTMRCAVCAQEWQTTAIDPHAVGPEAAADVASDAEADEDIAPVAREDHPGDGAPAADAPPASISATSISALLHGPAPALAGWVLSLGVLCIAGQATVEHRAGIVAVWPASQRLFLWLGLG